MICESMRNELQLLLDDGYDRVYVQGNRILIEDFQILYAHPLSSPRKAKTEVVAVFPWDIDGTDWLKGHVDNRGGPMNNVRLALISELLNREVRLVSCAQ